MTNLERGTIDEALIDLRRIESNLRMIWSNIDYRLGILSGGDGSRLMVDVCRISRARMAVRQAIKEIEEN